MKFNYDSQSLRTKSSPFLSIAWFHKEPGTPKRGPLGKGGPLGCLTGVKVWELGFSAYGLGFQV